MYGSQDKCDLLMVSQTIIAGLEYGMKQWTGMMEWKVEWNSEHTQLQLTCI